LKIPFLPGIERFGARVGARSGNAIRMLRKIMLDENLTLAASGTQLIVGTDCV
jgi:hypothetical protein